jgi:AAA family ATP:ADP antiporter
MTALQQPASRRGIFLAGAALIVAHQVAGKAVRDGLFLSHFSPADLPKVIAGAALISVFLGLFFARLLSRYGPLRLVPAAFATGALLHVAEFVLLRTGGDMLRSIVITAVYLHLVAFGAILLSGFWSIANEFFDPRAAKREFGKITGAGTVGGICGGLLAERGAALMNGESLLILLAILHLAACVVLTRVPSQTTRTVGPEKAPGTGDDSWRAARDAFRHAPFLVNLSVLVLLGTVSATLLDYLFKTGATATYGKGAQLTRYFAIFYTAGQVLTFLTQTFLTPAALRRLGLGRTMQWHPTTVALGAGACLFFPQWIMVPAARALELILRGSFLRSSYELFFTPVPPREKRAVKMLLDVSCDRMGDAVGAGVLQLLLLAGPQRAVAPILLVTATLAAIAFSIARSMDKAYSKVLEHGLLNRAIVLNEADVQDSVTLNALLHSTTLFRNKQRPTQPAPLPQPALLDPLLARLGDLRSGSAARIRTALAPDQPFDPAIVPLAIRLLAWGESFEWARGFLLRHAHRAIGQLVDALLDPEGDFAVRRRIPHILAYTSSQRAVDGLTEALVDPRFEIRFHVSRALEFLHRMSDGLQFDCPALMTAVNRELSSSRSIWEERKLLDSGDSSDSQYWFLDEHLRDRANKSLEHVFSLLAIQLPVEPLHVAFRALHSDDRMLRGLALEFLESHLSPAQVKLLRRLVEPVALSAQPQTAVPAANAPVAMHLDPLLVRGGSL